MIVFFDGICNLCNFWVDFLIRRDAKGAFWFSAIGSGVGNSVVVLDGDRVYFKSGAVIRVLTELGGAWRLVWVAWVLPWFLRDLVYDLVAWSRYFLFGKRESCRLVGEKDEKWFL